MTRRQPPLNALRAFEATARLGSIKAAAAEINVTPGAVSRHVQVLEGWLGAPLFERVHRRIVLTDAGAAYLAEIRPAFDRIAAATELYGSRRPRRPLRINALPTFTVCWLIPRLADFQDSHPDCEVRVTTGNEPVDSISAPHDLVVRGGPDTYYGYRTLPFLDDGRTPVCTPRLARRMPLGRPADLRFHTLLHAASFPRGWSDWLSLAGAAALEPAGNLVLDHIHVAIEAARAGLGVALAPLAMARTQLAEGSLVAPFPEWVLPTRSYCAYIPRDRFDAPEVAAFRAWLQRIGAGTRSGRGAE